MNKNFTSSVKHMLVCLLLSTFSQAAFATDDSTGNYAISFNAAPTLLSGNLNQVGSKYRFSNVTTGRSAVVTIVAATGGATVDMLDDNNLTKPEAFSPRITVPARSTGMVEFKIEFMTGNSFTPKKMDSLFATAMDIDGNATLREMDAINMGGGSVSFASNNLQISVVQQNGTEFLGTNMGGVEYPEVDTSAKQVMFTVAHKDVISFTYRAGAQNLADWAVTRQKGIYFKGFTYATPTIVLPVTLLQFTGSNRNGSNLLNWQTGSELNSKAFYIEKSRDGILYSTIGQVDAAGYSNTVKAYTFNDGQVKEGLSYYRLRMVDKDGSTTYSNIVTLKQEAVAGKISLFPCPATDFTIVTVSTITPENITLRMLDKDGKQVFTRNEKIGSGATNIRLGQLDRFAPGTYYLQVIQESQTTTRSFVIL
jgi:hypothetical protein